MLCALMAVLGILCLITIVAVFQLWKMALAKQERMLFLGLFRQQNEFKFKYIDGVKAKTVN